MLELYLIILMYFVLVKKNKKLKKNDVDAVSSYRIVGENGPNHIWTYCTRFPFDSDDVRHCKPMGVPKKIVLILQSFRRSSP